MYLSLKLVESEEDVWIGFLGGPSFEVTADYA